MPDNVVDSPDENKYVFCKIVKQIEGLNIGDENIEDFQPNTILFVQFKYVRDLFERGQADLI